MGKRKEDKSPKEGGESLQYYFGRRSEKVSSSGDVIRFSYEEVGKEVIGTACLPQPEEGGGSFQLQREWVGSERKCF